MAPENNWLNFSLSSMGMLSSSSSPATIKFIPPFDGAAASSADSHHPFYYSDHFYSNATWQDSKPVVTVASNHMSGGGGGGGHHQQLPHHDQGSIYTSFLDQNHPPPKLEDFLGGDSTETQDSSLTHIYDHGGGGGVANSAFFSEHHNHQQQDLKNITRFQAFSTNSGSEVDDSASAARTQVMCGEFTGQSIESGAELVPYPQTHCPNSGVLTLAVRNNGTQPDVKPSAQNAIVPAGSDSNKKLASETFGQRTSVYRGVTRHRWTGRYEAHLWDNSCRREGQARKGRQVYLGGYDKEDKAARAYDLAALKYWGPSATTNLPVSTYAKEIEDMKHCTKQEFIASLRRKSSGFSRGASIYRGVTRHHQQGRWQARIGRVAGNKDLYLGTFATEEEAAEAYDIAAIKFRGLSAVTNFEMNRYDVETIMRSALPIGPAAKRLKLSLEAEQKQMEVQQNECSSGILNFASFQPITCAMPYDATTAPPPYYHQNLFHHQINSADNAAISQHQATGAVSTMAPSMPVMMQTPGEYFMWPHQSY